MATGAAGRAVALNRLRTKELQHQDLEALAEATEERRPSQISTEEWRDVSRRAGVRNPELPVSTSPVDSTAFNAVVGIFIGLNAVVIGLETELDKEDSPDHIKFMWYMIDTGFCILWLGELCAKLHYKRMKYFSVYWNLFDCFLVVLGVVEVVAVPVVPSSTKGVLRMFRILRMLRLLRLVRLMRMIREVWVIVGGFLKSLSTLGWVLLLLLLVLYSCGVFMTILVGHACEAEYSDWTECGRYFGNVLRSMYSLFQVLTLDWWSMAFARPIIKEKPYMFLFFLCFLMITTFGLLNIIVGVVVENTLSKSEEQRELMQLEEDKKMRQDLLQLRALFEQADNDGNGDVDKGEFCMMIRRKDVLEVLSKLHIPADNPERLFDVLDADGGGSLSIHEFILGVLRLKREPTSQDMRKAVMQIRNITHKVSKLEATMEVLAKALGYRHPKDLLPRDSPDRRDSWACLTPCGSSPGSSASINGCSQMIRHVPAMTIDVTSLKELTQRRLRIQATDAALTARLGQLEQAVASLLRTDERLRAAMEEISSRLSKLSGKAKSEGEGGSAPPGEGRSQCFAGTEDCDAEEEPPSDAELLRRTVEMQRLLLGQSEVLLRYMLPPQVA